MKAKRFTCAAFLLFTSLSIQQETYATEHPEKAASTNEEKVANGNQLSEQLRRLHESAFRHSSRNENSAAIKDLLKARGLAEKADLDDPIMANWFESLSYDLASFHLFNGYNKKEGEAAYRHLISVEERKFGSRDKRLIMALVNCAHWLRSNGAAADSQAFATRTSERALAILEDTVNSAQDYVEWQFYAVPLDIVLKDLSRAHAKNPKILSKLKEREVAIRVKAKKLFNNRCNVSPSRCPADCYRGPSGCSGRLCTRDVICRPPGYDPYHSKRP